MMDIVLGWLLVSGAFGLGWVLRGLLSLREVDELDALRDEKRARDAQIASLNRMVR